MPSVTYCNSIMASYSSFGISRLTQSPGSSRELDSTSCSSALLAYSAGRTVKKIFSAEFMLGKHKRSSV